MKGFLPASVDQLNISCTFPASDVFVSRLCTVRSELDCKQTARLCTSHIAQCAQCTFHIAQCAQCTVRNELDGKQTEWLHSAVSRIMHKLHITTNAQSNNWTPFVQYKELYYTFRSDHWTIAQQSDSLRRQWHCKTNPPIWWAREMVPLEAISNQALI